MVLAVTQTSIGAIVLFIAFALAIAYAFINNRGSRREVGSEIELAANRKPYYSDEELEGKKLDRTLTLGLLGLFICAVGLPLYWLAEPGRQDGAVDDFKSKFVNRGAALFATTEEGGFNCAFCHGGMEAEGGEADYTITANGAFVKQVKWKAPALNTVLLRYSRAEVRYILTYGRPFSPMAAWGLKGGGPMNDQQIQNLIDYLESIQLTPEESQQQVTEKLAAMREETNEDGSPRYPASVSDGELLFNLGYDDNFAGGAYSCGRCHTTGWSHNDKTVDGNGALGPSLRDGSTLARFPGPVLGPTQQSDFVCAGSEEGKLYGRNGQGTGRMPGFCSVPEAVDNPGETGEVGVEARDATDPNEVGGMMTKEMVDSIVAWERGALMLLADLLAAITWTPGFRGILVVAVGVGVLMGSVYLLLATNSGARLGFLLALTGLMGWMTIMGLVWSIYGIGKQGAAASWHVKDLNYADLTQTDVEVARQLPEPDQLPTAESFLEADPALAEQFPEVEGVRRPGLGDLLGADPELEQELDDHLPDGWILLAASDPQTGEAQAAASAYVVDERTLFEAQTDFVVLNSFSYGGKERRDPEAGTLERAWFRTKRVLSWPLGHPSHYAVVQLQGVVPQETPPGEAPPLPVADETQPVISVIMERDLGARRLPSVGVTIFSGIVFAVCCNSLHRRDKLVAEARAAAARA